MLSVLGCSQLGVSQGARPFPGVCLIRGCTCETTWLDVSSSGRGRRSWKEHEETNGGLRGGQTAWRAPEKGEAGEHLRRPALQPCMGTLPVWRGERHWEELGRHLRGPWSPSRAPPRTGRRLLGARPGHGSRPRGISGFTTLQSPRATVTKHR